MPNKRKKGKVGISIVLDEERKERIAAEAKRRGMTITDFILWCVAQVMKLAFISLVPHVAWAWISGKPDFIGSGVALWLENIISLSAVVVAAGV